MSQPRIAIVFPGQGSQAVGMGQDFAHHHSEVRTLFESFDSVVPPAETNRPLTAVMAEGPEETLKRTLFTQPAIVAVSIAAWHLLKKQCPELPIVATAGHSLGEFPALYAAGSIDLDTLAKLVVERAKLMEDAPEGTMAAVLGLDKEAIEAVLVQVQAELPVPELVVLANDNAKGQAVISGTRAGIDAAMAPLKEAGAKRVLPLPVGGAFHSPLMNKAAEAFTAQLDEATFSPASFPVISNIDARPSQEAGELKDKLSRQIPGAVQWTSTMETLVNEFSITHLVELGPGKVLTGLMKKTFPDVQLLNVYDCATLEAAVSELSTTAAPAAV